MPLFNTRAIVLRSVNLSETDKIVTFMTEKFGKIKGVAKSARKIKSRFGAALEPMSYIQLIYFGKENQELFKINHCDIIQSFQSLREDFAKLYTGVYFAELFDVLLKEGDHCAALFQFLLDSLVRAQDLDHLETLRRLFELRLISLLGYAPKLNHCILCKKNPSPGWIGFSYHRGGIVCESCSGREKTEIKFRPGTLNYLKKLSIMDVKHAGRLKIPKEAEPEIEMVTHRLVLSHLGREPKSYPFIKQMAALG
ncbi:MAG: DNA repair protein RecO [Nitrospinae bacterium]|nr:DNA repair protein RecO [Nitrospinota bacterium]